MANSLFCILNSSLTNIIISSSFPSAYVVQRRLISDSWELTDKERPKVSELDVHKRILTGADRCKLRRQDFHQFMKGKRPIFSTHLKVNLQGKQVTI